MTYMSSFSNEFEKIALDEETVGNAYGQRLAQNKNYASAVRGGPEGGDILSRAVRGAKGLREVNKERPIYKKWMRSKLGPMPGLTREGRAKALKIGTGLAKGFSKAKLAGEMQGFTRIGRKPISIEKMLSNESEITGLPEDFAPAIEKAAGAMVKMAKHRAAALVGGGAVGALLLRQMNEDRRLGRMLRKQQAQQGQ